MAVLLDTSAGEIVIDLHCEECPLTTRNFLKLCQTKYYNGCLFYNVQANFILQTGDPTGTGFGGNSAYGIAEGVKSRYFPDEIDKTKKRRMDKVGLVCMAHQKEDANLSQFFITLRGEDMQHLEEKHTIFGEVAEGFEVLETLNQLYCDGDGRPYQDVRIKHTYILDDPHEDIAGLAIPPSSPEYMIHPDETIKQRIPYEQNLDPDAATKGMTEAELEASIKQKEAHSRAMVLEMTGDIPDADVKPPAEVLFVCKLNPVTTDEDLELIFSRFGTIKQCEIIRDYKTGDSLNYAFIEFETEDACIEAYEKMNNVLIDERRIKVDFSQSVSKLWNRFLSAPRKGTERKSYEDVQKDRKHGSNGNGGGGGHEDQRLPKTKKYYGGDSRAERNAVDEIDERRNPRHDADRKMGGYDRDKGGRGGRDDRRDDRRHDRKDDRKDDRDPQRQHRDSRDRVHHRSHHSGRRDSERGRDDRERGREDHHRHEKRDRSRDRDRHGGRDRSDKGDGRDRERRRERSGRKDSRDRSRDRDRDRGR